VDIENFCIFIQSIAHHKLQIITFFDNTLFKSLLHLLPQIHKIATILLTKNCKDENVIMQENWQCTCCHRNVAQLYADAELL
jgi:hypothetical protein